MWPFLWQRDKALLVDTGGKICIQANFCSYREERAGFFCDTISDHFYPEGVMPMSSVLQGTEEGAFWDPPRGSPPQPLAWQRYRTLSWMAGWSRRPWPRASLVVAPAPVSILSIPIGHSPEIRFFSLPQRSFVVVFFFFLDEIPSHQWPPDQCLDVVVSLITWGHLGEREDSCQHLSRG